MLVASPHLRRAGHRRRPGPRRQASTTQAEQASERYNDARLELKQAQTRLDGARRPTSTASRPRSTSVRDAGRHRRRRAVPGPGALLDRPRWCSSDDPDAFLDQLTTSREYNDQQSQMMADFAVQAKQLELRAGRRQARARPDRRDQEDSSADEKAEIDDKAAEAKELLGELKAEAAARAAAPAQPQPQPPRVPGHRRRRPPAAPAPPSATRSPRSATPTSTARPARAPSTAPA